MNMDIPRKDFEFNPPASEELIEKCENDYEFTTSVVKEGKNKGKININKQAIEGHHMLNVNDNPAFAGDGEVIQFLDKSGHLGAHAIHKYYGSAIDDNSISDEIIAIDRECFSNTGEFLSTNIDEYIFNVSVNNSSISKKMLKGSNTPINKLVRYCPETDTIEELS